MIHLESIVGIQTKFSVLTQHALLSEQTKPVAQFHPYTIL